MSEATIDPVPVLFISREKDSGWTRVALRLGDTTVSDLEIVPFTLGIGAATVRMDGIGGVGTAEAYRNRGYSRRVLEAAVAHMQQGDAALSMLYGIRDFYPKFGFATAGPDHLVFLTDLVRDSALPEGWHVRPYENRDLPRLQAIYAQNTQNATGAVVRTKHAGVWTNLRKATDGSGKDACRVVETPTGQVAGYLWRARWCWYVAHALEPNYSESLVLGEVMAENPVAADAALAACRQWAQEEQQRREIKQVALALPPEGPLASAAMAQDARFLRNFNACGGSMARVLNISRLLTALCPEFEALLRKAQSSFTGTLTFQTDIGNAALQITPQGVTVSDTAQTADQAHTVKLPQTELARLALGAFPPADRLARLPTLPESETAALLEILFPLRYQHMYLPDRY